MQFHIRKLTQKECTAQAEYKQWLTIERHNRKRKAVKFVFSLFCTQTPGLVTKLHGSHKAPSKLMKSLI